MRLLNVHTFDLREFHPGKTPRYAIASHRWSAAEATIKDILKRRNTDSQGFRKIEGFATFVRENVPGVEWLWIDTCCRDQRSSAEVSEAVVSMFRWYANAEVCLVWLGDVENVGEEAELKQSGWFYRGWTLQDLLAPRIVIFLTRDWKVLGHKGGGGWTMDDHRLKGGPNLDPLVAKITGIPEAVLQHFDRSLGLSIEQPLTWMNDRQTTREEDQAYSMLGIFGVSMAIVYGEGAASARKRLLRAISETSAASSSALETREQTIRSRRKIAHSSAAVLDGDGDQKDSIGSGSASSVVSIPLSRLDQPSLRSSAPIAQPAKSSLLALCVSFQQVHVCYILVTLGLVIIGGT